MTQRVRILAIDLGTSRVKVGLVDEALVTLATSSQSYPTSVGETGRAEQSPAHWLSALHAATTAVLAERSEDHIDAVVLTAQMPTLVAIGDDGGVIGNAVTWQDSRADALVERRLDQRSRERVQRVAGTPIDGRYIIPMHLRRYAQEAYRPTTLLSAKDYLFFAFTNEKVTDPSTASGFGNYDLARGGWSDELSALWGIDAHLLPRVLDPHHTAPLTAAGALLLPGVPPGTPVMVGAADSVCAHHFITTRFAGALSVIDGSSTVIMATVTNPAALADDILITPLVDPTQRGAEMDLLATGSSIAWLARLLALAPAQLEELALTDLPAHHGDLLFLPYLAGGEQGAIWRTDISGSIHGLTLGASRADLARALFEGIAIETLRCIEVLRDSQPVTSVVSVASPDSRHFGASLLAGLLDVPVLALAPQSPSLLGAALTALESVGDATSVRDSFDPSLLGAQPELGPDYLAALNRTTHRYREVAAKPVPHATREDRP